jgi:hypothetical protein
VLQEVAAIVTLFCRLRSPLNEGNLFASHCFCLSRLLLQLCIISNRPLLDNNTSMLIKLYKVWIKTCMAVELVNQEPSSNAAKTRAY